MTGRRNNHIIKNYNTLNRAAILILILTFLAGTSNALSAGFQCSCMTAASVSSDHCEEPSPSHYTKENLHQKDLDCGGKAICCFEDENPVSLTAAPHLSKSVSCLSESKATIQPPVLNLQSVVLPSRPPPLISQPSIYTLNCSFLI